MKNVILTVLILALSMMGFPLLPKQGLLREDSTVTVKEECLHHERKEKKQYRRE